MDQGVASKRQIFSSKEAFTMLSKELMDIIKEQNPHMYADSVGDDVYVWDVFMAGFNPGSALAEVWQIVFDQ